jgi:hypothetical protein
MPKQARLRYGSKPRTPRIGEDTTSSYPATCCCAPVIPLNQKLRSLRRLSPTLGSSASHNERMLLLRFASDPSDP